MNPTINLFVYKVEVHVLRCPTFLRFGRLWEREAFCFKNNMIFNSTF